ncbi:MAG: hypothetical protein NVSMB52_05290 [Chloroflexota bacterium]
MEVPVVLQPSWLNENLLDTHIVPIDFWPPHFFLQAHLPGAASLPTYCLSLVSGDPPLKQDYANRLDAAGATRDTRLGAYDDGRSPTGARLFWILRLCQHPNVSILDGGIAGWLNEGFTVDEG